MHNARQVLRTKALTTSSPEASESSSLVHEEQSTHWIAKGEARSRIARPAATIREPAPVDSAYPGSRPHDRQDSSSTDTIRPRHQEDSSTPPLFASPGASGSRTAPGTRSKMPFKSSIPSRSGSQSSSNANSPRRGLNGPTSPPSRDPRNGQISRNDSRPQALTKESLLSRTKSQNSARSNGTGYSPTASGRGAVNPRDELLMMLLSSQAVLDSREYEIISAEELEELTLEYDNLSKRSAVLLKRVALEKKMRDAASSLNKLGVASKSSKDRQEGFGHHFEQASTKAESAQNDLLTVLEKTSAIQRRLLEHRSAVLSHRLRQIEQSTALDGTGDSSEDYGTSATTTMSGDLSPVSTAPTSLSLSSRSKFEGAHLYAGHENSRVPALPARSGVAPTWAEIESLQEKLTAASESAEHAKAEVEKLSIQLQKVEGEELLQAQREVARLEGEIQRFAEVGREVESIKAAKGVLQADYDSLQSLLTARDAQLSNLLSPESRSLGPSSAFGRDDARKWDSAFSLILEELQRSRAALPALTEDAERGRADQEELRTGRALLMDVAREQGLDLGVATSTVTLGQLATAFANGHGSSRLASDGAKSSKEDLNAVLSEKERLEKEIEDIKERAVAVVASPSIPLDALPSDIRDEHLRIMTALQRLWLSLPSTEARAKLHAKSSVSVLKAPRSPMTPTSPKTPPSATPSLSDMDVRSLKTLYGKTSDPAGTSGSKENFSVDGFVDRVQAVLADDRALVERLVRMASGHELLKSNAERARKLALESSQGLETYQKQVRTLEERNAQITLRNASLLDDMAQLQQACEQALQQKSQLETALAEQASTLVDLEQDNRALNGRLQTMTAEIQTSAPTSTVSDLTAKAKLEAELATVTSELKAAKEELDRIHNAEATQRIQMLDELNAMQKENGELRDQVRALNAQQKKLPVPP